MLMAELEELTGDAGRAREWMGRALHARHDPAWTADGFVSDRWNDNLDALRFYQRRGFALAALRPNAVSEARLFKPEIPLVGDFGIPLRDEIELEMWLATGVST